MVRKLKPNLTGCNDCAYYTLHQASIKVDLTEGEVTAYGRYVCVKGKKPNFISYCPLYSKCYLEDSITWFRGEKPEGEE